MHSMFLPFSLVEQLYLKHFLSFNQFQVFVSQFCQRFFLINSLLSSTAFWTAKQFLEHLVLFNSSIQYFFLCFWTHFMHMTEIHILGCIFSFLVLWNNNVLLSSCYFHLLTSSIKLVTYFQQFTILICKCYDNFIKLKAVSFQKH